jgi:hypothetical protein
MNKTHAAIVALLLAVAAMLGVLAAARTVGIGAAARPQASSATITARARRLDQVEAALRKALRDRPPALPAVPGASAQAASPAIVYRRPAPLVVVRHTGHHEDGEDHEQGEGGDD